MANKFYAIRVGKKTGIVDTWNECKSYVTGYKNAEYKSFLTLKEAEEYIQGYTNIEEKNVNDLKESEIIAYVDGSYNIKTKTYGYGIVLIAYGVEKEYVGSFIDDKLTSFRNVAGELMATKEAVKLAIEMGYKCVYISYDYTGIKHWAEDEWKTNNDLTKSYKEYMMKKKQEIDIKFIKIEAHSGNIYNDRADYLAKKSAGVLNDD